MRLVSYRTPGATGDEPGRSDRLGIQLDNRVVDAADLVSGGPASMRQLLSGLPRSLTALQDASRAAVEDGAVPAGAPIEHLELLPPVPHPGKIVAIGVNYRSHAEEQGREPAASPVIFAKFTTALVGHGATIRWDPDLTQAVDFEAELGVVIGRRARHVSIEQALDHVLGYTCLNDVSARDLQYADKQFVRAKSLDSFCPMGPALVTADEIPDPQALAIRCLVNGQVKQSASTAEMVAGVAELISFCSRAFTLEPGDIIATGTPAGVGWFREPKEMLRDSDEVVVEIEGVGRLVNHCREASAAVEPDGR